jgi:hypothetical protein
MAKDVFISYSSHDKSITNEVCEFIEKRGVACWIAPRDVTPGAVFDEAIIDAIETTQALVLILSGSANESPFVKNEVNRAFAKGKAIFTFRIEGVTPGKSLEFYLARHHWTDGFPPPLEEKLGHLANAILALLGKPAPRVEPKRAPDAPAAAIAAPTPQPSASVQLTKPTSQGSGQHTRYSAEVTLPNGEVLAPCEVFDHNPGPIGSGWEMKQVSLCRTIDEAVGFRLMGDAGTLQYADIARIDVLRLSPEEHEHLKTMANPYYREKILKCDLTMKNGSVKRAVFLLPNYLRYSFEYEAHDIREGRVRAVRFCQ